MDAMPNINAIYKLKASLQPLLQGTSDNLAADRSVPVECVIHLGERLSNPAVTFDVHVPGTDPETGVPPGLYRTRVTQLVSRRWSFSRIEDGRVLFKAEVASASPSMSSLSRPSRIISPRFLRARRHGASADL